MFSPSLALALTCTLMLVATGLPTTGSSSNSTTSATTTLTTTDDHSTVHVPWNGTVEFDCDRRTAIVVVDGEETSGVNSTTLTPGATTPANNYVLGMFKKDRLVVQVNNPKMRVEALGVQNEGNYECGYHQLDKFGKLNYVFQKAWNLVIDYPKVEVPTTTPETVARGEMLATPESLTELLDLGNKKNINIFTYSNPAIVFVLVAGFLVICATFLVIILLFNVKTCRSCQRPRGKELL